MPNNFWLFETYHNILTSETDTNSQYDLIEGTILPGKETPLHVHSAYSQTFYVLEGELTIYIKDVTIKLNPGKHFFIPKGTPHVVICTSSSFIRALTITSPSGFAKVIRTAGTVGVLNKTPPAANPCEMDLFMAVSQELGDIILGFPGSRP